MQLEAVCTVPVSRFIFKIRRQLDNVNRFKWTLLCADTATNAESLTNVRDLARRRNFNAETAW